MNHRTECLNSTLYLFLWCFFRWSGLCVASGTTLLIHFPLLLLPSALCLCMRTISCTCWAWCIYNEKYLFIAFPVSSAIEFYLVCFFLKRSLVVDRYRHFCQLLWSISSTKLIIPYIRVQQTFGALESWSKKKKKKKDVWCSKSLHLGHYNPNGCPWL